MAKEDNIYGMHTFEQRLLDLWKGGLISEQNALAYATHDNDVRLQITLEKQGRRHEGDQGELGDGLGLQEDFDDQFT